MEVVKTGMQHGDLSLDAYTQVTSIPYFWFIISRYLLTEIIKHRSGKNVWPRFSSFLGNSDTQGDPVKILRISVKFANIVLAQGQPCLQEGPHRVPWEEAGHEQGPHDQGGEESRQDREKAENSHWRLSGPGQNAIHRHIFSRRKHFIVISLRAVPPVWSSSWRTLESSLNKPGWSWRHSTS